MDQESKPPLSIEHRGSVTVIHFHRAVSQSQHLNEIESKLQEAVEHAQSPRFVIDFADVAFFPSTGVGLIVATRNDITKKHGVLAIANMTEMIEHMFTLTGLTKVLPIYDSVDEAVDALSQAE